MEVKVWIRQVLVDPSRNGKVEPAVGKRENPAIIDDGLVEQPVTPNEGVDVNPDDLAARSRSIPVVHSTGPPPISRTRTSWRR